ncbi:hypothetical protein FO519_002242 [Halicephalobus sp. NKZ332]|nr:hypothetical protein FO519_002242 [Halicephalobus sp. NKZ332]
MVNPFSPLNDLLMKVDNTTGKFTLDWKAPEFLEFFIFEYSIVFEILTLCLSIVDIVIISIMFYVFNKSPQFHYHLIALIKFIYFFFIVYGILKAILVFLADFPLFGEINEKTLVPKDLLFLEYGKMAFGAAYLGSLLGFTVERAWATICLEHYEKIKSRIFLAMMLLEQIGFGLIIATLMFLFPEVIIYGTILGISFSIFQMICFIVTDQVNQRRYKKSITVGNAYTLSQRFQLSENIRVFKRFRRVDTEVSDLSERKDSLKTSKGKQMVFRVEDEADMYFKQLNSWL